MRTQNKGEDVEKGLVRQLRRGDASAMRRFYDLYAGDIAGVCSRYVADDNDAKDVFQDSMVKIMYNIHHFEWRGEGSLRSWAMRVASNVALDFIRLRRKAEMSTLAFDVADEPEAPEPDVADIPPEVIHDMIRALPDGYRTVFNLYAIEGKSHKEIARLLGIRESSSASQFHRAKNQLVRAIMKYREKLKD